MTLLARAAAARRAALVIAHPDDETLWCGGLLRRNSGRFLVICCSIPRTDPIRACKFYNACAALGVEGRVLPVVETEPKQQLRNLEFLDSFNLSEFDLIVTHNAEGEYGHAHHQHVHRHVMERWPQKTFTIGFRPGVQGVEVLKLSESEIQLKLSALQKYDHVLPYGDRHLPKWEALMDRYCDKGGVSFGIESYDPPRSSP
jgi:LmbE family N-acetylglucosaminyl deacetylase